MHVIEHKSIADIARFWEQWSRIMQAQSSFTGASQS